MKKTLQQHERLSREVGNNLAKFIEVVKRELSEIKFRGIEFTKISISLTIDAYSNSQSLNIDIWTSALSVEENDQFKSTRFFHFNGTRKNLEDIFCLIQWWKDSIVRDHQKLIKSFPLFKNL